MRTLPLPFCLLMAATVGLAGCGGPDSATTRVEIVMPPELQGDIRVTEQSFLKPGAKNPVEASVSLKNEGNREYQILLDGKWQNDSGQGFGGASDSRVLQAGTSTTFSTGTRSRGVTRLVLRVSETAMDSKKLAEKTIREAKTVFAGHGLSYTPTPTMAQIPNWSPRGLANGVPFAAGTVLFSPINGVWELQVIDRAIDPLKGLALARSLEGNAGLQSIHLQLSGEPRSNTVSIRKLETGGGYFQIQTSPGADQTTSWNTEIAWFLVIKKWQRQPYVENGGTFQQGGTASGKLYVCFKGYEGKMEDAFVAGVFVDAPIVYYGNPGSLASVK